MMRVPIKPLSVNQAWQGKRFKTPAYRSYEESVLILLKPYEIPEGELELSLEWGFSNYGASDTDNPIKPFVDCLQKRYGFNDNRIKRMIIEKSKVKKGEEYIKFSFKHYKELS